MRLIRCGIAYGEGRLVPAPRNCWDLLHAERDIVLVIPSVCLSVRTLSNAVLCLNEWTSHHTF